MHAFQLFLVSSAIAAGLCALVFASLRLHGGVVVASAGLWFTLWFAVPPQLEFFDLGSCCAGSFGLYHVLVCLAFVLQVVRQVRKRARNR